MKENKDLVETINYEMAILVRRGTSMNQDKKLGNLERSHYLLMQHLADYGAIGVKALADEFHLDVSTVSRQAAALEAKGYIQRLPDPEDGRASFFQLTELGIRELADTREARMQRYAKLLKDWSDTDRQKFAELLTRFNRTFID
ncbi:MarR family winged helix-turn-helix transcriptional regulator [Paenibacillus rigui]|uniref:MarR family transcriptional regulator n=1 Tax=Paenibacillus rigui TaxID=554312 RepID=A0A229UYJ3_9BACL|nr:MarR family transcriptional regulator [Paenibacillus rigui]OXM88301.1 MarR family transcriptional regulator [Paenibacillus rigui]